LTLFPGISLGKVLNALILANQLKNGYIFKNETFSSINQGGYISNNVNVYRGCQQGDPLSTYIFIFCAEILTIRIRNNRLMKGLHIKEKEVKLRQFPDDTTLILDGSEQSAAMKGNHRFW